MPKIHIELHAVELLPALVEELKSVLQPAALSQAREELDQTRASFPNDEDGIRSAQKIVDKGGDFLWTHWSITSAEGIQYSGDGVPSDAPDEDLFNHAQVASFTLRAGRSMYQETDAVHEISIRVSHGYGDATVTAPEDEVRHLADQLRGVMDRYSAPPDISTYSRPFKVFIAYGGGPAWEIVRNYLRDAGVEVDAFTESERVGEVTIDVVSQMINSASMAVIVMTAAEQLRDGERWFARQNVVHEAGFAQGVLGVRNTIILLEEGVEMPSNLTSVTYIPFPRGAVHTTQQRVVSRVLETKADVERSQPPGVSGPPFY